MNDITIVGYRDWAKKLYEGVRDRGHNVAWHEVPPMIPPALTFFVGWSKIVNESYYTRENKISLVLHPSPLPKYRGGSPIQHQIINGERVSAVTIFKLDPAYPEVDTGPIAWQMPYSLEGSLDDVLDGIAEVGALGVDACIRAWLQGGLAFIPQDETIATTYPRRTPEQSEILFDDFQMYSAEAIHNKIRALQEPYPLPFVRCRDGRKLYIHETSLGEEMVKMSLHLEPLEQEVEREASTDAVPSVRAPSVEPSDGLPSLSSLLDADA